VNDELQFAAALEHPTPVVREAFLDRVCGPDAPLRGRLERLLAAHERTAGVEDTPPWLTASSPGG
jgi:hypothetical protein